MTSKPIISTKFGDTGRTRLYSGETLSKASAQVETLGHLDELVSVLGLARYYSEDADIGQRILNVQRELFTIGSEAATTAGHARELTRRVDQNFVDQLEQQCQSLYAKTEIPKGFIVPGSSPASSYLDHARAVARRAERSIVYLHDQGLITNPHVLVWMNRLSDYLYLMARYSEENPTMVKLD